MKIWRLKLLKTNRTLLKIRKLRNLTNLEDQNTHFLSSKNFLGRRRHEELFSKSEVVMHFKKRKFDRKICASFTSTQRSNCMWLQSMNSNLHNCSGVCYISKNGLAVWKARKTRILFRFSFKRDTLKANTKLPLGLNLKWTGGQRGCAEKG